MLATLARQNAEKCEWQPWQTPYKHNNLYSEYFLYLRSLQNTDMLEDNSPLLRSTRSHRHICQHSQGYYCTIRERLGASMVTNSEVSILVAGVLLEWTENMLTQRLVEKMVIQIVQMDWDWVCSMGSTMALTRLE
mmetsp:Transcript_27427/g.35378  ORF Transcript_27427/g.35378 Transcript_27427/m.35378 type:complete len:135 (+) Transcript_27427:393-797(+)